MRALNPFTGEFYREALQVSRSTREMFCLMEGRHVHPSTLYAGGVGTVATIQLMTDYMSRLMRYVEFMKKVVPMHDDLFDFFYEALPGYEQVGLRRTLLGCWGAFQDPEYCDFSYAGMSDWGRKMFVTPGVVVDGKLVTNDLVDINLGIRIMLGSSYYDDWDDQEIFVTHDPLGNPVDRRHPWNQHTNPQPQKRDLDGGKYSWVMSPRWYDGKDHLALDTGGGPLARLWSTALSGLVDIGYVKATGHSVLIELPKTALKPPMTLEWKIPQWSNTLERNRARSYFQAYAAACALHFAEKALEEIRAGRTKTWEEFEVPEEAISCGFTEAVRGVLSHHMVIRDGKIANYHPYPPTPWNASPRDSYGTPGTLRGRGAGPAAVRGEPRRRVQGHRRDAHSAELRPLPALRGAHVPRQREDAAEAAHADDGGAGVMGAVDVDATVRPGPPPRPRLPAFRPGSGWVPAVRPPAFRLSETDRLLAAGERIERVLERGAPGSPVAREDARDLVRVLTELYGVRPEADPGPPGRGRRARRRAAGPPGRRPAGRQPADGARPAPLRHARARRARAGLGARPGRGARRGGRPRGGGRRQGPDPRHRRRWLRLDVRGGRRDGARRRRGRGAGSRGRRPAGLGGRPERRVHPGRIAAHAPGSGRTDLGLLLRLVRKTVRA